MRRDKHIPRKIGLLSSALLCMATVLSVRSAPALFTTNNIEPQFATCWVEWTTGQTCLETDGSCSIRDVAVNQATSSAVTSTNAHMLGAIHKSWWEGWGAGKLWVNAQYNKAVQYAQADLTDSASNGFVKAFLRCEYGYTWGADSDDPDPDPPGGFISRDLPFRLGQVSGVSLLFDPAWMPCPPPSGVYGNMNFYWVFTANAYGIQQNRPAQFARPVCYYVGHPINVEDGNVLHTEDDLVISTPGLPLAFSRAYNSTLNDATSPLGPCWTYSYHWRLLDTNTTFKGTNVAWKILQTGSGVQYWFLKDTNTGVYSSPPDNNYQLVLSNGQYRMTMPARSVYTFDTNGVLLTVADLFNNTVTLTYTNAFPSQLLTRVDHSFGKSLYFTYSSNRLSVVDSPSTNLSLHFYYNAQGELTNATRHLSAADLPAGYAYDSSTNYTHCMTQCVDSAGRLMAWSYATNQAGQLTSRGSRSYHWETNACWDTHLDYETNIFRTTVTYDRGGTNLVYQYYYHPILRRVEAIHGPNNTNDADWKGSANTLNDSGEVTTNLVLDLTGGIWISNKTVRAYDDFHHVTNRGFGFNSQPSNFWRYAWDPTNQVMTSETDPEGHQVLYEYTNGLIAVQRLVFATDVTFDTRYSYTTNGQLTAVTNANGHWVQYVREGCCPEEIIPEAGPKVILDYDELRHLKSVEMPGETGARITYYNPDELGRVLSILYPDDLSESFSYDGVGNLLTNMDRAGRATRYTYTVSDKPLSITRVLAGGTNQDVTVSFSYDKQFNLTGITDPLGRAVKTYQLDDENRPVQIMNVESQVMTATYVVGDYVSSVTRYDGTVVSNLYDTDGRLYRSLFPGETNELKYYRNNLLKTARNSVGTISNTYDTVNRLTTSVGVGPSSTLSYAYFPAGQISTMVSVAGTTVYSYDAGERVSSVERQGSSVQFTYNTNNGLLSTMTYPNGVEAEYDYDRMDRITGITWTGPGSSVLRSFEYSYDAAGMITNIAREDGEKLAYSYDSLDQLTGETRSSSSVTSAVNYAYDLAGNRLTKTRDGMMVSYSYGSGDRLASWAASTTGALYGVLDVVGNSSETIGTNSQWGERTVNGAMAQVSGTNLWAYDVPVTAGTQQEVVAAIGDVAGNVGRATNFVTMRVATNGGYEFNAAGCVTNIRYTGLEFTNSLSLAWNSQYQLTSVRTNGGIAESYQYDAFGRRTSIASSGITNYLVYDGIHCIAEVNSSGVLQRTYTYGPGIDNVLSMTVYGVTTGTYYYLKDHLGSVHALADTNGAIVESYRYDAWGRVLGVHDSSGLPIGNQQSAIGNRFLFQGREYSWATGLYYFRARWYDPVTGRWVSRDELIEDEQSITPQAQNPSCGGAVAVGLVDLHNAYQFLGNCPAVSIDPFGLWRFRLISHGNWCGPNWTGRHKKPWNVLTPAQQMNAAPPVDALDICCMDHDICFGQCRENYECDEDGLADCLHGCNLIMANCLRNLNPRTMRSRYYYLHFRRAYFRIGSSNRI